MYRTFRGKNGVSTMSTFENPASLNIDSARTWPHAVPRPRASEYS